MVKQLQECSSVYLSLQECLESLSKGSSSSQSMMRKMEKRLQGIVLTFSPTINANTSREVVSFVYGKNWSSSVEIQA